MTVEELAQRLRLLLHLLAKDHPVERGAHLEDVLENAPHEQDVVDAAVEPRNVRTLEDLDSDQDRSDPRHDSLLLRREELSQVARGSSTR